MRWIVYTCLLLLLSGCSITRTSLPGQIPPTPLQSESLPTAVATATSTTTAPAAPTFTVTPQPPDAPTQAPTPTLSPPPEPVQLIGAGDIAACGEDGDERTAAILARFPDAHIFTAGDNAYESGRPVEFRNCFDPSWGVYKDRISPSPGNHDYFTPGAAGYFEYFGAAAGDPTRGYYSYDLGAWHIVALNSLCGEIGGCGFGSPQEQWLRADLESSSAQCTLAYWHQPRWSSGLAGNSGWMSALWRVLVEYGVEVAVSGHDHHYERFAPQDGDANPDPKGVRQFVVGTGGSLQRGFGEVQPNSEVRNTGVLGVILFTLYHDSYTWEFIPEEGQTFTDSGSDICH